MRTTLGNCVNNIDLLAGLFNFGQANASVDLNGNGIVNGSDLLYVLFDFGSGCE